MRNRLILARYGPSRHKFCAAKPGAVTWNATTGDASQSAATGSAVNESAKPGTATGAEIAESWTRDAAIAGANPGEATGDTFFLP